ncbi:AI-2E family transporter [Clostridium vincentii]|uniref:Pheromone autoinducer 2 transporter n=1 Tax=Clostridium vincentii TaxID=52704 RepID=A0A2T0B721_9CLOT|nr:AI-2E family transporter [Clostridium vincentii]PRR79662.1 pheromone autoinducer 2 transporter [Clostridium vincentii]
MRKKKIITNLLIGNLTLVFLYLLGKFQIIYDFTEVFLWVIVSPIIFGVFLFYILRPLNRLFTKKGIKNSIASTITIMIALIIFGFIIMHFGRYLSEQIYYLKELITKNVEEENIVNIGKEYLKNNSITGFIENISKQFMGYISLFFSNLREMFNKGMMVFSNILLVILVTFFLLKDGGEFKQLVLKYSPEKYTEVTGEILDGGDTVLSTYIIGQATVALSLAIMIFIGYKLIGMPSALLFSFTTFILAFIPFIGFLISMIIPFIIATTLGSSMLIKLAILFLVAQTLKGRVVVPLIMGKIMKIHPITDIFLVVGAAALGGPIAAFCIVPVYSLIKVILKKLREKKILSFPWDVDKTNKV